MAYGLLEHYAEISNITRLSAFVDVLPDEESALNEASPDVRDYDGED